jgi:predicted RNase H-like HicB family nuclease
MNSDIILRMGTHTYIAKIKWINEDGGYYFVEFPSLKGCITYGHTLEEAVEMAKDALAGWLSVTKELGWPIPRQKSYLKRRQKELIMPFRVSVA